MSSSIARRHSSSLGRAGRRLIIGVGLLAAVSASCISTGRQIAPDSSPNGGASSNTGSLGQTTGTGSSSAGGSTSAGGAAPGAMAAGATTAGAGAATTATTTAATTTTDMSPEIAAILQTRCAACHTYGQADLGGWGSVMDLSRMVDAEIVTPGNPSTSRMIDRISVRGDMPPRGERVPTTEVDQLRAWITSLRRPVLTNRSDEDVLDAIAGDVLGQRALDTDFRYFSLAHFVDMGRPASEVTTAKNVLAFLVNSLSRRGTIVPMVAVDNQQSIFRVRLSDLGWSAALWDQLTSFYPYCLASDLAAHQSLYAQLGTEAPVVRADWLWDTASRAPLYDLLVNLPNSVNDLARTLGVNISDDINHPGIAEPNNLVRFAVARSGVALHNRMAERHLGTAGQYLWISYDFRTDSGRQDVFANPLGPALVDRQNFVHTFQNDAGEVIFTMPNGMQGYMLVNAQGNKIAVADTAIVRDIRRPGAVVENGISCFGCHGNGGMIRPRRTDEMRSYIGMHVGDFLNREFNEITFLYPPMFQPDYFNADAARYRGTVQSLDGGGPPANASEYSDFVTVVGQYESNLGFRGAAAEFNQEPTSFEASVAANDPNNRTFARSPSDPLVSRTDMVCAWRALAPKIRAQRFCNKTFNAAAVQGLCR